jgi:hypothetical protein
MPVEIRRAIRPPDLPSFTQGLFGGIDLAMRSCLGHLIPACTGIAHSASGSHQL